MYVIYITRVAEVFGVTKTREIYQKAMQKLPEKSLRDIAIKFAAMERRLGEIDRARGTVH